MQRSVALERTLPFPKWYTSFRGCRGFSQGATKSDEICFFPLKTKKTTFFCWISKSRKGQGPPLPPLPTSMFHSVFHGLRTEESADLFCFEQSFFVNCCFIAKNAAVFMIERSFCKFWITFLCQVVQVLARKKEKRGIFTSTEIRYCSWNVKGLITSLPPLLYSRNLLTTCLIAPLNYVAFVYKLF